MYPIWSAAYNREVFSVLASFVIFPWDLDCNKSKENDHLIVYLIRKKKAASGLASNQRNGTEQRGRFQTFSTVLCFVWKQGKEEHRFSLAYSFESAHVFSSTVHTPQINATFKREYNQEFCGKAPWCQQNLSTSY